MCADTSCVALCALLLHLPLAVAEAQPAALPLAKGGSLVVIEDHNVPVIRIEAHYPVGSLSPWWQDFHLDDYWPLLVTGVDGIARPDLFDLSFFVDERSCGWSALVLAEDADLAVTALVDELQGSFGTLRIDDGNVFRQQWREGRHSPGAVLERSTSELYFQRDDVRRRRAKRPRGLVMDAGQLTEIRDGVLALDGWVLGVAGDISTADAEALAARIVEVLPDRRFQQPSWTQPATLPLQPPGLKDPPLVLSVKGSQEALLAWTRPGLERGDPAAAAALLADAVVIRRLQRVLRDQRGDIYAIDSRGLLALAVEPYSIVLPTAPWSAEELAALVEAELAKVATLGLDPDEVERARRRLEAQRATRCQAPAEQLRQALWGLGAMAPEPELSEVPYEAVDAFARRFYDPASLVGIRVIPKDGEN
jgi:hypothetical protein